MLLVVVQVILEKLLFIYSESRLCTVVEVGGACHFSIKLKFFAFHKKFRLIN